MFQDHEKFASGSHLCRRYSNPNQTPSQQALLLLLVLHPW
jgi:hypothetical protein